MNLHEKLVNNSNDFNASVEAMLELIKSRALGLAERGTTHQWYCLPDYFREASTQKVIAAVEKLGFKAELLDNVEPYSVLNVSWEDCTSGYAATLWSKSQDTDSVVDNLFTHWSKKLLERATLGDKDWVLSFEMGTREEVIEGVIDRLAKEGCDLDMVDDDPVRVVVTWGGK